MERAKAQLSSTRSSKAGCSKTSVVRKGGKDFMYMNAWYASVLVLDIYRRLWTTLTACHKEEATIDVHNRIGPD